MGYRPPLQELLSVVLRAYTAEFERQLADAGFPDLSLALGTNVLRFLDDDGMRLSAVAELAGLSKQAISQQVAYLEIRGYIAVSVDRADRRAKILTLTSRGRASQIVARDLFGKIEDGWHHQVGTGPMRQLRNALEAVAGALVNQT